ncbi:MAG: tRNA lysidine(34) synthetase TilS [Dokdonella sp.]
MNPLSIEARLAAALEAAETGPIAVGLSGGSDSTVLLHVLAGSKQARERGLRAVHVDHGLHSQSAEWALQAVAMATALDVPCTVLSVQVERNDGIGPEAAARAARYAAWADELREGEILTLAHHRDDQVETLLLKLLRGAGTDGLGAMRAWRPLATGWLWRPLLDVPRTALADYANCHQLRWIDDPSNTDQKLDRNYLRHRVLPLLRERWPQCDAVIARGAEWQRSVSAFLDKEIVQATSRLVGQELSTLCIDGWLNLDDAIRDGVLRLWLRRLDLPQPTHVQAVELTRQMLTAAPESCPLIRWRGAELRRYRELLHAMEPLQAIPPNWSTTFDGSAVALPADLGVLSLEGDVASSEGEEWRVGFRRGGERIRLAGETFHRSLRDLYQQHAIPPWQRDRMPIITDAEGNVLAVGERWLSATAQSLWTEKGQCLRWKR